MLKITAKQAKKLGLTEKKCHKYGAKATVVDGIKFHSKKEANRYCELRLAEKVGQISYLSLQPMFRIVVNGKQVGKYYADFKYKKGGEWIFEDVKGFKNQLYRFKKKLVEALHGIEILET